jgi:preprotein translocase subunit SecA
VSLALIDDQWKEHLRNMDDLRSNVQHAQFEQKDPLLIYKFESYELFKGMVYQVNERVASFLMQSDLPANPEAKAPTQVRQEPKNLTTSKAGVSNLNESMQAQQRAANAPQRQAPQKVAPIKAEKTVGRNEPCPCGSGKKYKQCHGKA